ncbi:MAG: homoserine kinase [Jaaginema sp. PMC 1079.18]|nr:homoserine kinase [Jaaginema sp. PMC 1080.18]MEC4853672.1 homoserine kinase [Jaaginema sp. PMC 1079.18]MEC4868758.1 homoserine kinase [Jaaginema sp. PMC 1078.18]
MSDSLTVTVPATTANLGAGFDCIGAALTLYNHFHFSFADTTQITVVGSEAAGVSVGEDNLLYRAFTRLFNLIDRKTPSVAIKIELGIPLSRGLGSSATAILGGLVGANELAGRPLADTEILQEAIAFEGHPDNVVPAFLGSCQLSVQTELQWHFCPIPWSEQVVPVVAIPNFELSTEAARAVLPHQIDRADAIFNIARLGLLVRGLDTANPAWLTGALADKLHQPYRQRLIRGYEVVRAAARDAGAYGLVISGAGPTLLALCAPAQAQTVATALQTAWATVNVTAQTQVLAIAPHGTRIHS